MYSLARRTALAALLIVAVVAVFGAHANDITFDTAGQQYSVSFVDTTATIHVFPNNDQGTASGVMIGYHDSTVSGDTGLVINGLSSTAGINPVTTVLEFSTTLVVDSTISVVNALPAYYELSFLGVQALSQSAGKPVLSLNNLVMGTNNTLVVRAVSAKWNSGGNGVVVAATGTAPTVSTNSGLFITAATVNGTAASVFTSRGAARVSGNSIFAVDGAQCTGCSQPIVSHDGTLEVDANSIYRVSKAAAGSSQLIKVTSPVMVSGGSIFQASDSSVTGSNFFDFGGDFVLEESDSKAVFTGLTGANAARVVSGSGKIPTDVCSTCNVYGGASSTTAGGSLDTVAKWVNNGVAVTVVVAGDGTVANGSSPNGPSPPQSGECSDALCLGANTQAFGSAGSCACECKPSYNAPSCSSSEDLGTGVATECTVANCQECNVDGACALCVYGYTLSADGTSCTRTAPSECAAPHCVTCQSGTTNKCVQCEPGYLPDGSGVCIAIPECVAPNCDVCERLDGNTCKVCSTGSAMVQGKCTLCLSLMDGCAKCTSATTCTECVESYKMENGRCVRRFNGATTTSPVTLALVALAASVLAAYTL